MADTTNPGSTRTLETRDGDEISVFVADDEEAVIEVLRSLIGTDPMLRFTGAAYDAEAAVAEVLHDRPDVVLLDVRMPGGGGTRAAREISRRCPSTKVIALTAHEDADAIIAMISAGASAYIPKADPSDKILRKIHHAFDPSWSPELVEEGREHLTLVRPSFVQRSERGSRVARAILTGAVQIAFHPIVDLETEKLVGLDARPRVDFWPPRAYDGWLADARAEGLLLDFELTALRAVLPTLRRLPGDLFIEFEVTPSSVVSARFRRAVLGTAPSRIVVGFSSLEIRDERARDPFPEIVLGLRGRGVRISARDVGSGFESLRQIARLSPHHVWLDPTIAASVDTDFPNHSVAAAVAGCAVQVDARVIATGVTSRAQAGGLQAVGVHMMAGPLVGDPLETAELPQDQLISRSADRPRGGSSSARRRADEGRKTEPATDHRDPGGEAS